MRRTIPLLVLGLSACGSPPERDDPSASVPADPSRAGTADGNTVDGRAPAPDRPWTEAFLEEAVLVADHVRIEGPAGLLDHVVVSADDAYYDRETRTTSDGLLQVVRRRSDDVREIRAQVDAWLIVAFEKVTVLERVGDVPVTIVATGEAAYRTPLGEERREETLRFVGERPAPDGR